MLPQVLFVLHQPVGPSWDAVTRGKRSMVGVCGSLRSRPEAHKPTSKKKLSEDDLLSFPAYESAVVLLENLWTHGSSRGPAPRQVLVG